MRNITIFLLIILSQMSVYAQQNVHMFVRDSTHFDLQELNGKMGLVEGSEILVPHKYDAVFPSVEGEYSFIVNEGLLGVYDHVAQKEFIYSNRYDEIQTLPATNGGYIIILKGEKYNALNTLKRILIERQEDNTITQKEVGNFSDAISIRNGDYTNGIQRVNDHDYIHHSTHVSWEEVYGGEHGEEEVRYRFNKVFQQSGIYSVKKNMFVVTPEFSEIYMPYYKGKIHPRADYIYVKQFNLNVFLDEDWRNIEFKDEDEYLYKGLVTPFDYNLVLPPQSHYIYVATTGEYFLEVDPDDKVFDIFNKQGESIFQIVVEDYSPWTVSVLENRVFLGYPTPEMNEEEMRVSEYYIYTRDGKLLAKETMLLELPSDPNDNVAYAGILPTLRIVMTSCGVFMTLWKRNTSFLTNTPACTVISSRTTY